MIGSMVFLQHIRFGHPQPRPAAEERGRRLFGSCEDEGKKEVRFFDSTKSWLLHIHLERVWRSVVWIVPNNNNNDGRRKSVREFGSEDGLFRVDYAACCLDVSPSG